MYVIFSYFTKQTHVYILLKQSQFRLQKVTSLDPKKKVVFRLQRISVFSSTVEIGTNIRESSKMNLRASNKEILEI